MREKYFLYVTDERALLYRGAYEEVISVEGGGEKAQGQLETHLLKNPRIPLRLLVDRSHQDIREEKLPPLFIWERLQFLFHKKAEWSTRGGFFGAHFFKQEGATYIRYIHILEQDVIASWIMWAQTLSNPFEGVLFAPLEARRFLKHHMSFSKKYQLLLYNGPGKKKRHAIFMGQRLLLFRITPEKEDLKTSLHFLSRTFPDIYENLQGLSLGVGVSLTHPFVKTVSDSKDFLNFIASLKRPSLPLNVHKRKFLWVRGVAGGVLMGALLLAGSEVYKGLQFKNKTLKLLPEIERVSQHVRELKVHLKDQDVVLLRTALTQYGILKSQTVDPLKTFQDLSRVLNNEGIRLVSLRWEHEKKLEITLSFFMNEDSKKTLSEKFEEFLVSCKKTFPKGQIHVVEAPFHSGVHEIYKPPLEMVLPRSTVKIVLP